MIIVHAAVKSHCAEIAEISSELGYPSSHGEVLKRFSMLCTQPQEHGVFVAITKSDAKVVGWVHVYGVCLLESDGYAEIGGLVVRQKFRRLGIGRALMAEAESWSQQHKFTSLRLRSGMHRADEAHLFYQNIGFMPSKQSIMFQKNTV